MPLIPPTTGVVVVFACVYLGMGIGRWPGLMLDRTGIALVGAIVLVLVGAVTGEEVRAAIDVPTLVILFGLMVLSAQFAACGFYDWCSHRLARTPVGPMPLLALTVVTSGVLSAFLANDVVVFAMTPMLTLGLQRRGLDPRPFLIALAAAANAGSAATIIGNPQNILIGQTGGLDILTFIAVCGPPALIALALSFAVVWLVWRGRFELVDPRVQHGSSEAAMARSLDRAGLVKALMATAALLLLFATPLPRVEGVLLVAGALLISRRLSTRRILGLVDWHLLVLFAAL
ncbi:MAG: SLC13 family permease, partial [Geminicoccaceae bacterium]